MLFLWFLVAACDYNVLVCGVSCMYPGALGCRGCFLREQHSTCFEAQLQSNRTRKRPTQRRSPKLSSAIFCVWHVFAKPSVARCLGSACQVIHIQAFLAAILELQNEHGTGTSLVFYAIVWLQIREEESSRECALLTWWPVFGFWQCGRLLGGAIDVAFQDLGPRKPVLHAAVILT